MRSARSILSSLVSLTLVGCVTSPWPPHVDELQDHFAQHRGQLEELANFMREKRLWTIASSAIWPPAVGFRTPGDQAKSDLTPDDAAYVASLLSTTQEGSVTRIDSIVYFSTGEGQVGTSYYTYGYIQAEAGSDPPQECAQFNGDAPYGECRLPLQGSWSARYFWRSART